MAEEIKNENEQMPEDSLDLSDVEEEEQIEESEEVEAEEVNNSQGSFLADNPFALQLGIVFLAIALLIVLLVGIFSGVSFSTILWRLISFGALFFILGFGIGVLLKMFVPEIMDIKDESYTEEGLGENIDYVTEEEDVNELTHSPGMEDDGGYGQERLSSANSVNVDIDGQSFSIENDPETLAKAVKTVYHRDDSSN